METKYGHITDQTVADYKKKLHKKIFWLLLYKDPQTADKYKYVDFDHYFTNLMKEIIGLQGILAQNPGELIELMSILQAAYNETQAAEFNYHTYRKFVLDAHTLVDKMKFKANQ